MKMIEPDYWKGRGRYSKQALSRAVDDESPLQPLELSPEATENK